MTTPLSTLATVPPRPTLDGLSLWRSLRPGRAVLVALIAALVSGCVTPNPIAQPDVTFTPSSEMAMVAIGAGGRQRGPTTIRFDRLSDEGDRLDGVVLPGGEAPATRFTITGADRLTPFLVKPGRYVISRIDVVTGSRTQLITSGGYSIKGLYIPPSYTTSQIDTGYAFNLSSDDGGFATSTWVVSLRRGRVTAVGNVLVRWNAVNRVMSVESDTPDLEDVRRSLSAYKNVKAPIVLETVSEYRPDRPPPLYRRF